MMPATLLEDWILFSEILTPIALVLSAFTVVWFALGMQYYVLPRSHAILGVILVPVATFLHSIGTTVGLLFPPGDFRVTEKVRTEGSVRNDPRRDARRGNFDSSSRSD